MNDKVEMRVCNGNANVAAKVIVMIASPVAVLAVMGLVFLWHCPEYHSGMLGGHWYVKHQLCWNVMGVVAFCMPLLAEWSRWLKLAPAMAAAWLVMFAASQFCPQDGGGWFVLLGPIRLDVMGMLPFSLAMLLAWISHKFGFRAVRVVVIAGVSALLVLTASIATNANRVSRHGSAAIRRQRNWRRTIRRWPAPGRRRRV